MSNIKMKKRINYYNKWNLKNKEKKIEKLFKIDFNRLIEEANG